jgi:putative redox protein
MHTVTVRLEEGLRAEVFTGTHRVVADEPVDKGGGDEGPDPYGLLLGALGTCTAMTLRLYADRKGWDLRSVTVDLTHDRMHRDDCEDCAEEETRSHIDRIGRVLTLEGDLDEEQRARLLQIAGRCPVARTLGNAPEISSRLA